MDIREILKLKIVKKKCIDVDEADVNKPFLEYELDSMEIVAISGSLEKTEYGVIIYIVVRLSMHQQIV